MERADFLARIVQATQRLASLPAHYTQPGQGTEWESALNPRARPKVLQNPARRSTTGTCRGLFELFHVDNPASIRNCIEYARSNARSVRTALTTEMWEAINGAWFELKRFEQIEIGRWGQFDREELNALSRFREENLAGFRRLRTIAPCCATTPYWFTRLGVYLERADNTARVLDG